MERVAEWINVLGEFCGRRDVPELTSRALLERFGFDRADVMVLFGGSIVCGGDVLAQAMRAGVARKYIIVGGAGHTTETLRRRVHEEYPQIETEGLPEAEVFSRYLSCVHGLKADALETESTNCGNNITNLLAMMREKEIPCGSIILCQDATMQRRMEAGLRKHAPEMTVVNYAAYRAVVEVHGGRLDFAEPIHGMWDMDRYVNLLMGEIPRLTDDANGYGPCGRGFIAHVDVPGAVKEAFENLKTVFGVDTREANPAYASKEERK